MLRLHVELESITADDRTSSSVALDDSDGIEASVMNCDDDDSRMENVKRMTWSPVQAPGACFCSSLMGRAWIFGPPSFLTLSVLLC